MPHEIKSICIIGAGNMGHQIALLSAIQGYNVKCIDVSEEIMQQAQSFAKKYLAGRAEKGAMSKEQAEAALLRLQFTTDLAEAARDADYVIEAAVERLEVKKSIFAQLDKICPPHTILATNSSAMASSLLADVVKRPDKLCNMHFFNPALVMRIVEVVRGPQTSDETVEVTMNLAHALGKTPVYLMKEIEGFIVTRVLGALMHEAISLVEKGIASPQDIDIAVEGALNHPMGPFRLMDLTGIDLTYTMMEERFKQTGNPEDKPPAFIAEKYKAGHYGRKTGQGFYKYQ